MCKEFVRFTHSSQLIELIDVRILRELNIFSLVCVSSAVTCVRSFVAMLPTHSESSTISSSNTTNTEFVQWKIHSTCFSSNRHIYIYIYRRHNATDIKLFSDCRRNVGHIEHAHMTTKCHFLFIFYFFVSHRSFTPAQTICVILHFRFSVLK